jgi:hypothetical protein
MPFQSFSGNANYPLLGVNAAIISGIFIFFAIASQSIASNLFSINAERCSFGLSPEEGEMAVAISGGVLIIPFAISSILVLLRNDWHAVLIAIIGFGLMAVAATMVMTSLACRLSIEFVSYAIIIPASLTILVITILYRFRSKKDEDHVS